MELFLQDIYPSSMTSMCFGCEQPIVLYVIKEIKSSHFSALEVVSQGHADGCGYARPAIRGQKKAIRSSFRGKVQRQERDIKRRLCCFTKVSLYQVKEASPKGASCVAPAARHSGEGTTAETVRRPVVAGGRGEGEVNSRAQRMLGAAKLLCATVQWWPLHVIHLPKQHLARTLVESMGFG